MAVLWTKPTDWILVEMYVGSTEIITAPSQICFLFYCNNENCKTSKGPSAWVTVGLSSELNCWRTSWPRTYTHTKLKRDQLEKTVGHCRHTQLSSGRKSREKMNFWNKMWCSKWPNAAIKFQFQFERRRRTHFTILCILYINSYIYIMN